MLCYRLTRYLILSVLTLGFLTSCSDDPAAPIDEGNNGTLLLSRISAAMVTGGSETISIITDAPPGKHKSCTVLCSDPDVASVTSTDSTFTVTGVAVGNCVVTVESTDGCLRSMPVQIYDPTVIDTGELLVTYTDEFLHIYSWAAGIGCSLWKPIPPEGFYEVGWYLGGYSFDPNGQDAVMVVKAKPGSDAVAFSESFETVLTYNCYWYRPIPPTGYKTLGMVVTRGDPPNSIACIRDDLTMFGASTSTPIYTFYAYDTDWSFWGIEQPDAGPHTSAYLAPGAFLHYPGLTPPTLDPTLNVLKVELPQLAEAPAQLFMPTLTSYQSPPTETAPRFARAMLVPCTAVRDAQYENDMPWRIANSPFYRLERQVYYKLLYHNYNQTSEVQTNTVTIRSGVTTTESASFHQNTGVSIAVETGIDIKFFSSKVTTTLSLEMGYETQTAVAELEEKEVSTSINTAAGKAAALWQEFNRFVLYRHDGTELQPVSAWEFGIDSYVTDEYPN